MRGMSSLNWLLPISSIGFLAFVGVALYGAIATDWSAWLSVAIAAPGIPFIWLGLMLALLDVTRRPNDHLSDAARMVWTAAICILNVFAFIPYWLFVIRSYPPIPEPAPQAQDSGSASVEQAEA